MHCILDLDLDFFVWPIARDLDEDRRLRQDECEYVYSENDVRQFLEEQCGLDTANPLVGQQFAEHVEAFKVWRRWLSEGKLTAPFDVVHVDAHGDFGAGYLNNTHSYLEKVLTLPMSSRSELEFSPQATTSGNYLTLAIANRWVSSLTYVYPIDPLASSREISSIERALKRLGEQHEELPPVRDVPAWLFQSKKERWSEGCPIQLSPDEPQVDFRIVRQTDFRRSQFTHIVVAQSPQYTPESADTLLPVVEQYLKHA